MKKIKKNNLLIDLNHQPVSNRFLKNNKKKNKVFQFKIVQNIDTGLVKIEKPFPARELKPKFDWITYTEPEKHLSSLMKEVLNIKNNKKKLNIGGISFKDDSLLELFSIKGHKTWRLDLQKDLSLSIGSGVESIQSKIGIINTKKIINKYKKADVIIIRHIWEHIYNQKKFIINLNKLLNKDGIIVFEIPDSSKLIRRCDYTMPWEEHLFYYSPRTFFESLNKNSLSILFSKKIKYPYEDVLYAIAKPTKVIKNKNLIKISSVKKEIKDACNYAINFKIKKQMINNFMIKQRKKGPIALFGAGHMAVSFISYFGLKKYFDFIIDGNENKIGLYTPSGDKKIYSPEILKMNLVKTCFLGMNPLHHNIIKKKFSFFKKFGGNFYSIYKTDYK